MAQFLYFLPGEKEKSKADLTSELNAAGLAHIADDGVNAFCGTVAGPDKQPGVVFTVKSKGLAGARPPVAVGFYPDAQTWAKCNGGKFWVGYENNARPEPRDLARERQLESLHVKLGDDHTWLVPIARRFDLGSVLPEALALDDSGQMIKETLPQYIRFSQMAGHFYDDFCIHANNDGLNEIKLDSYEKQIDLAVEALRFNYQISKWEVSALRLLATDNIMDVLLSTISMPSVAKITASMEARAKKKSASAESLTDTPATPTAS